jgi:hypothetical protein
MADSGEDVREAQRSTSEAFTQARSSERSDGFDAETDADRTTRATPRSGRPTNDSCIAHSVPTQEV